MSTLPVVLFAVAALLTFLAAPLAFFLADSSGLNAAVTRFGLILLSILRGGAMIFGMVAVARGANTTVAVAAVLAMEVASCALHFATGAAHDSTPHQYGFEAIAMVLPLLLIAAGFLLRSNNALAPMLLWAGAVLPVIAGGLGFMASNSHVTNREIRTAEQFAKRTAELNALPADSPVELLLPFIACCGEAKSRIINSDRAVEQLKDALNGPNAAAAKDILPEVERTLRVRKRKAELDAVPPSAGLAAVLSFYAPGEDAIVRGFVEDRLRNTPDGEAQLVKALAGPHALEAIAALNCVAKYRLDDATYNAVFPAAAKVAERLNNANPPLPKEVDVLTDVISHMAERSGEEFVKAHREELTAVYQMARRAGKADRYDSRGYLALELALGLR